MDSSYLLIEWMPIESLPLFRASIDIINAEAEQQHDYISSLKRKGEQLNRESIVRITSAYQAILNKAMCYNAQLERWMTDSRNISATKLDILLLMKHRNNLTIHLGKKIIEAANDLASN